MGDCKGYWSGGRDCQGEVVLLCHNQGGSGERDEDVEFNSYREDVNGDQGLEVVLVDAYFVYWYIYSFRLLSGTPVLHKFESIMSSFEPVHQNKRHDENKNIERRTTSKRTSPRSRLLSLVQKSRDVVSPLFRALRRRALIGSVSHVQILLIRLSKHTTQNLRSWLVGNFLSQNFRNRD